MMPTFFSTPVAKNAITGINAITPISPSHCSSLCSTHHNTIVSTHTALTHHCVSEKASLLGRIGLISSSASSFSAPGTRDGRYDARRSNQMRTIEMDDTGIETANHLDQSSLGSISASAIRFCGEEMGDAWPPMFAARAMAILRT